jgi:hypothetical protein
VGTPDPAARDFRPGLDGFTHEVTLRRDVTQAVVVLVNAPSRQSAIDMAIGAVSVSETGWVTEAVAAHPSTVRSGRGGL